MRKALDFDRKLTLELPMGLGINRPCSSCRADYRSSWTALVSIAVVIVLCPKTWGREEAKAIFDDLDLPALKLGARPELRHLSAQGNRFQRLDLSGAPRLDRLLLFGNPFNRRGKEALLSNLVSHGQRGGFLGLNGLDKQTLGFGGRMNLATLRSRAWQIPVSGPERHFDLLAKSYFWIPPPLTRGEAPATWSYAPSINKAKSLPLPSVGFADDMPRWFQVTAPTGFHSVTSIDFSNKGLIKGLDLSSFASLFHAKLFCNHLETLNLRGNSRLSTADLSDNRLKVLDLSGNPDLEQLRVGNNDLAVLSIDLNSELRHLDARYNRFSSEAIDSILTMLVVHGEKGGTVLLDGGGNEAPTARGRGAAWVLTQRSWHIQTNSVLDYDDDELPDAWELETFGGTHEDAMGDADQDGLTNLRERLLYLDPTTPDSDGDGFPDGIELKATTNPLDPNDRPSPSGVIQGIVWNDFNRDFAKNFTEKGIGGIKVFLSHGTGADRVILRTRTKPNGSYRFDDLSGGDYSVAIDWNEWKPLQDTVIKANLSSPRARLEIDFPLGDPSLDYSQWTEASFGKVKVDPRGDPDGDQYPNLLEYALGTNPLVANARNLPVIESSDDGDNYRLTLRYRVNNHAKDVRIVSEALIDGDWKAVKEASEWSGKTRQASIPVAEGEVGILRLRASMADSEIVADSPWWGGHALVLDPGVRSAGLPLVNSRLVGGLVVRNDATSVTLTALDFPLVDLLGKDRAYLEVVDGPFEGERWEVSGVQAWGDRISLAVDHAANTRQGALPQLAGQKVVVRPHVTLGQVFGRAGESVFVGSSSPKETNRIWFFEIGKLAPYHFAAIENNGRALGWSRWGDLSRFWDDRPIFPGEGFFAELRQDHGVSLFLHGEVRHNRLALPLRVGANFVAPGFPGRQSFARLGLTPLHGFAARRFPEMADQAFLWNGTGFDSYFLFGDSGEGSRWVRSFGDQSIDYSSSPFIDHDEGYFLHMTAPRRMSFSPSSLR
ncbi:MAG: hypothetical protein CMI31_01500 [Opitutae bacterium]|nr:hypothetical protein [Opitutae bacterium]